VSVAIVPETLIDAATFDRAPAALSVNVDELNVELFIGRLKVTETLVPVETPAAPAPGAWLRITGGPAGIVVKDHTDVLPSALLFVSVTVPATVTV
jgi:hypothetical protein